MLRNESWKTCSFILIWKNLSSKRIPPNVADLRRPKLLGRAVTMPLRRPMRSIQSLGVPRQWLNCWSSDVCMILVMCIYHIYIYITCIYIYITCIYKYNIYIYIYIYIYAWKPENMSMYPYIRIYAYIVELTSIFVLSISCWNFEYPCWLIQLKIDMLTIIIFAMIIIMRIIRILLFFS